MEFTGKLLTGDFDNNTMTFEIKGEMLLRAGDYKIISLDGSEKCKGCIGSGKRKVSASGVGEVIVLKCLNEKSC